MIEKTTQKDYSLSKIFKGSSIYSIGSILSKSSGFLLIPLYTRILSPQEFGIISYLEVLLQLLVIVVGCGFHGAQTRYYFETGHQGHKFGEFLFSINFFSLAFGLVIFIPISIGGILFGWSLGSEVSIPIYPYIVLLFGTVLFSVIFQNQIAYHQMKQEFIKTSIYTSINFLLSTILSLVFIVGFKFGAYGRVWGLFLGSVLFLLLFSRNYFSAFSWSISKSNIRYAIRFGIPVVIYLLVGTVHNVIDRFFLERMRSLDELGFYALGATCAGVLQVILTSFNQAYQPNYYQLMSSEIDFEYKNHQISRTFSYWIFLVTGITIVGIFIGKPFLYFFVGENFQVVGSIFPLQLVSVYLGSFYYFFSSSIFYFKKTHWLPIITGISALCNIILNSLLIPKFGIFGAAFATATSNAVLSIVSFYFGNRLFRVRWPYRTMFLCICSVVLAFWGNLFLI